MGNMKVTLAIFAALVAVAIAAPIVNHDIIAAVNNDESSTWMAGVNKAFEGMSVEQMKALLNVQVTKEQPIGLVGPDAAKTMQEEADRVAASLPSSFEAAKAHPECGTLLSQCADGSPIKRYHATGAKHITSLFG